MRRLLKWLAAGIAALAVLVALAGLGGYMALRSSVPAANGEAVIPGISGPVRVVRDASGIPHIEAASRLDAVRVLGYVQAQERLWQMHVLRMVAQGRLSEMFGRPTLDTDIFLKTVDIAGASRRSWEALSDGGKAELTAFAEGINAYIGGDTRLLETSLPPEFLILGVTPEPWEPWQSVALLKVMALTLDSNMDDEILRFALASRGFNSAEIDDLLPYDAKDNPPPLPNLRALFEMAPVLLRTGGVDDGPRLPAGLAWPTGVDASNNWVVAGSRTVSGKPLLANDPHLGLTAPTTFFLAHVAFDEDGERRNIIGATLPGTPLFLLGRNDRVAWGLTTTNLDSQDVFIERLKPDDPDQYLTPTGWEPIGKEELEVAIKGEKPVAFTRRMTRHGPVLPEGYRSIAEILPVGHTAALQWVSLAGDDTTVDAARGIADSRSVEDFIAATRLIVAPMQSMVVADVDGNIALTAPGRVPLRDPANAISGRAPVPGWQAQYDWKGWLAFDDLPRIVNPPAGALATANANWLPADYGHFITYDWDEPYRQNRVEQLVIAANERHSPETMRAIQADSLSPAVAVFRDLALAQTEQGAGQEPAMMEALKTWDGKTPADRPEPLIMTAWWRHFQELALKDELGKDFSRLGRGQIEPLINMLRARTSRDWCDDRATPAAETCGIILSKALAAALTEIRGLQGDDWRQWQWGRAHVAWGEHRPFSSVGALAQFFTVTRDSAGDSYSLLRGRTDFSGDHPYRNVHASAYRAWYDLGEPDKSQFIVSTGQGGHFMSPHYADQADRWAKVEYLPMTTRQADYEAGAEGVWNFTPAR